MNGRIVRKPTKFFKIGSHAKNHGMKFDGSLQKSATSGMERKITRKREIGGKRRVRQKEMGSEIIAQRFWFSRSPPVPSSVASKRLRLVEDQTVSLRSAMGYLPFLLVAFAVSLAEAQNCRTPSGTAGNCILLDDCAPLRQLLVQRPLPPSVANLLRESRCGFSGNRPLVCCSGSGDANGGRPNINDLFSGGNRGGDAGGNMTPLTQGNVDAHPNRRLLDLATCGNAITDRIIGGEEADVREYPWLALLQYQTSRGRQFLCGGALINSRYVMTAAHCVRGIGNTRLVGIRLGEHNLGTDPDCQQTESGQICGNPVEDFGIGEVIAHQQYKPESTSKLHDIALIRLDRAVTYSDFIQPICLPNAASVGKRYEGSRLIVAGWGKTENRSSSQVKLWVRIPVMTNTQCAPIYERQLTLNANQMCAGGVKGKDSCRGDSGGPLMSYDESVVRERAGNQWVAAGIVSIGPAVCGAEGRPGIYTRVGPYVSWILDQLKP